MCFSFKKKPQTITCSRTLPQGHLSNPRCIIQQQCWTSRGQEFPCSRQCWLRLGNTWKRSSWLNKQDISLNVHYLLFALLAAAEVVSPPASWRLSLLLRDLWNISALWEEQKKKQAAIAYWRWKLTKMGSAERDSDSVSRPVSRLPRRHVWNIFLQRGGDAFVRMSRARVLVDTHTRIVKMWVIQHLFAERTEITTASVIDLLCLLGRQTINSFIRR